MSSKILYLDCSSGISGDMTVAALLDLGADEKKLQDTLASLPLDGYHIEISRVTKSAVGACDFNVVLHDGIENHDHDMAYLHGDGHRQEAHDHEHTQDGHDHAPMQGGHDHEHMQNGHDHAPMQGGHDHEHTQDGHDHAPMQGGHDHEHTQEGHGHEHHHHGRNLNDITQILTHGNMTVHALDLALKIFRIVAEAEAHVHNKSIDEVHFHEVGAVDSIVDIASAAICLDDLGIDQVIIPQLTEGQGQIRCQHGLLPVPVPAVSAIAAEYHLPLHISRVQGELVTPTGAAIAAAVCTSRQLPERFHIEKIGIGAGKRDYACAGILRAMLIVPERESNEPPTQDGSADSTPSKVCVMETTIDDCSGEALGFVMNELFTAGALDVFCQPVYMKKNRPGVLMTVICQPGDRSRMEEIIFRHTTTIGIRWRLSERTRLDRREISVDTEWGPVQVKVCTFRQETYCYPESEDIARISRSSGLSFTELYSIVKQAAKAMIR